MKLISQKKLTQLINQSDGDWDYLRYLLKVYWDSFPRKKK